jgi:hypothetical protein
MVWAAIEVDKVFFASGGGCGFLPFDDVSFAIVELTVFAGKGWLVANTFCT